MKNKLIETNLSIMRVLCFISIVGVLVFASSSGITAEATNESAAKSSKSSSTAAIKKVNVEEFEKLSKDKNNVVLDVRTRKEFEAGHIPGALNLDINSPEFEKKVSSLDKSKTYLVHCAAGGRSARACNKLSGMGFSHLVDLPPGFKGWEAAGKKVEK